MAETRKVLGQSDPAATTLTAAYTVPGATQAVVSTITACNRDPVDTTIRISVAVAGAADSDEQYLVYDAPLEGVETKAFTLGITLGAADVVRVYAALATVSFNIFGVELT